MALEMILPRRAGGSSVPPTRNPGSLGKDLSASLGTRVLIIEDEMMIAWMIESLLIDAGFSEVAMASSADEAAQVASDNAPGLIISDINLGKGANGVEASIAISRKGEVPVIFVTAYADAELRQQIAAELPRAQVLRKPVESGLLIAAITRALTPPSLS